MTSDTWFGATHKLQWCSCRYSSHWATTACLTQKSWYTSSLFESVPLWCKTISSYSSGIRGTLAWKIAFSWGKLQVWPLYLVWPHESAKAAPVHVQVVWTFPPSGWVLEDLEHHHQGTCYWMAETWDLFYTLHSAHLWHPNQTIFMTEVTKPSANDHYSFSILCWNGRLLQWVWRVTEGLYMADQNIYWWCRRLSRFRGICRIRLDRFSRIFWVEWAWRIGRSGRARINLSIQLLHINGICMILPFLFSLPCILVLPHLTTLRTCWQWARHLSMNSMSSLYTSESVRINWMDGLCMHSLNTIIINSVSCITNNLCRVIHQIHLQQVDAELHLFHWQTDICLVG